MRNPIENSFDDTDTVETLRESLEELRGTVHALLQYCKDTHKADMCEHCGQVHPRADMLPFAGIFRDASGAWHPESSRYCCLFCVYAVAAHAGQDTRDRAGQWFGAGRGRALLDQWLKPVNSYVSSAAQAMADEFAPEIMAVRRRAA